MSLAPMHYQIRELLQNQGVIFCYSGYMNEGILASIGQAIKQKLLLEETDANTSRTVFSIFVEQMQNVIRYSAEQEADTATLVNVLSYGTLTVGRDADGYFIICGNKVQVGDVSRLKEQLTLIQQMSREDLKGLYKQILKGAIPEGSKGAGVGFVDIARRASRPIEFDFMDLDGQYAFFSLKATI